MPFRLTSNAFTDGGAIPSKYTCEGADISPPLAWSGAPSSAKSLALIIDDPDAPDPAAPRTIWVHWIVYDLPSNTTGLAEGVDADDMPKGAKVGLNDWKKPSYGGPCPPIGRHRYFHKLYALDTMLPELQKIQRSMQFPQYAWRCIQRQAVAAHLSSLSAALTELPRVVHRSNRMGALSLDTL